MLIEKDYFLNAPGGYLVAVGLQSIPTSRRVFLSD